MAGIRPEDHGGTTDPLAPLSNLSTRAGHGAGKAIDPTRPSAADLIPTPPGPTADRIAELKREIAEGEQYIEDIELDGFSPAPGFAMTMANLRAELSRLRNEQPELNSRGEPMDHATIAHGRNAQPVAWKFRWRGRTDWLYTDDKAQVDAMLCDRFYEVKPLTDLLMTTSPALPEGAREALEIAWERLKNTPVPHDAESSKFTFTTGFNAGLQVTTPSSAGLIEAAEWHKEREHLYDLLCVADQLLCELNGGCFPLPGGGERKEYIRDGMLAIREVAGEDYHRRHARANDFMIALRASDADRSAT